MTKLRNYCLLALVAIGLQACIVITEDSEGYEGLVVAWTIDGSDAATLCDDLVIDIWEVELAGPENLVTDVPCGEPWDTGNEFTGGGSVLTGTYDVTITAVDLDNIEITGLRLEGVVVDEFDSQSPDVYSVDFDRQDFL